ncbi:MAG: sigma-54 dependent transcriptional regulator [Rhodobacteraceae bacterium]|nr:sigma-54 dependent transcriptional regulator [Paracoccaceae bacterium]
MMDGTIIVADDDRSIRTVLSQALTRAGCRVRATGNLSTLWKWVEEGEGDVIVTDVMMPDGDALDLLPRIIKKRPDLPIIVMSAQNTVTTAVRASEAGAFDYMPKPFDLSAFLALVNKATKQAHPTIIAGEGGERLPLVGRSPMMQEVYRVLARLTHTDLGVMIFGDSGTGKEIVARTLHSFSPRKAAPFISINLAATPPDMIERELFGSSDNPNGLYVAAFGGTLFLDNVDDMPLEAQMRLLRVLQEQGGDDVRVVASTRHDLQTLVAEGRFREDLFFRLNVVPIRLPRLVERLEDIPDLARHFLTEAAKGGLPQKTITPEALDHLRSHIWGGNVRELENFIKRLTVLCPEEEIGASIIRRELAAHMELGPKEPQREQRLSASVEAHLKQYFSQHTGTLPPPGLYDKIIREVERPLIQLSLQATGGNQLKTADLLGINRNTLRKKIRELDIEVLRSKKMM